MSKRLHAAFEIGGWDEQAYREVDGEPKLTRAAVTRAFTGELEAAGTVEYLMAYGRDGDAGFVGIERVDGSLGGRAGSFVLQHVGTFDGGTARGQVTVVAGSGTGQLETLTGEGTFVAERGPNGTMELTYELG